MLLGPEHGVIEYDSKSFSPLEKAHFITSSRFVLARSSQLALYHVVSTTGGIRGGTLSFSNTVAPRAGDCL